MPLSELQNQALEPEPRESFFDVADDVQSALDQVATREGKERIIEDIGLSGARAIRQWDERADQVGLDRAAAEVAALSVRQPKQRPGARRDEPRNDWEDLQQATRRAVEASKAKAQREAERPQTMAELAEIERRHGSLDVVEARKRAYDDILANGTDAAPRVAADEAARQWQAATPTTMPMVSDFWRRHRIDDATAAVMLRAYESGEVERTGNPQADLQNLHAYAKHLAAMDIKNPYDRSVVSAQREQEAVGLANARVLVQQFEATHPDMFIGNRRARMRDLLMREEVQTMEQAYRATA